MTRFVVLLPLLSGCVVTTLEGPSEPPRVVLPPDRQDPRAQLAEEMRAPEPSVKIGARHLLVAYTGAMRAAPQITRTKDEARARAIEALDQIGRAHV